MRRATRSTSQPPHRACRRGRSKRCSARHWRRRAVRGGSWAWRPRACPPAPEELVRENSQQRLREAGLTPDEITHVVEAVPVASHNQRGIGTPHIGCTEGSTERFQAEALLEIVEAAMSSEIYELMKRSDEVEVVEKGHLQPRFVEDCVRELIRMAIERFGHLDENAFVLARQENLETIHKHNVVAERHGLLGELRREVDFGERVQRHVTKREWLEDVSGPAKP